MNRWGMVVDLNRCVGCQTCTIACKHANDTPPGVQWRRVLDVEQGEYPDVERLFLVVGCQHCANPPCVPVCPTGATRQRADGLVTMDYDSCIGCGYCAVSCPYQARTIVHEERGYYGAPTKQEIQTSHADRINVANKCTFCVGRIDEAQERGLTPGVDLEVTPACAAACISQAIRFGDFADPGSVVSELVRDNASFQMHAELGTDPQIKYLYEVPETTPGREASPADLDDDAMSDAGNPLVGERQTFWDFRAAMNFIMGGMSSGLAVMAYAFYLFGGMGALTLTALYGTAAIAMAVGLFFVFLEIGRKLRFLYVLKRPQSSWMTRETYFVAVFYPVAFADLIWPHPALHLVAAAAAAGFLVSQALILYAAKGIPAWRAPLIPWMLIATGVFEGTGLLALAAAWYPELIGGWSGLAVVGVALALINAGLWRGYGRTARDNGLGPLTRQALGHVTTRLHAVGHAVPLVLFGAPLVLGWGGPVSFALAGIGAVAGGVVWKFTVITRACHHQGYAVPKMPQRGSGSRAAPPRYEAA